MGNWSCNLPAVWPQGSHVTSLSLSFLFLLSLGISGAAHQRTRVTSLWPCFLCHNCGWAITVWGGVVVIPGSHFPTGRAGRNLIMNGSDYEPHTHITLNFLKFSSVNLHNLWVPVQWKLIQNFNDNRTLKHAEHPGLLRRLLTWPLQYHLSWAEVSWSIIRKRQRFQ